MIHSLKYMKLTVLKFTTSGKPLKVIQEVHSDLFLQHRYFLVCLQQTLTLTSITKHNANQSLLSLTLFAWLIPRHGKLDDRQRCSLLSVQNMFQQLPVNRIRQISQSPNINKSQKKMGCSFTTLQDIREFLIMNLFGYPANKVMKKCYYSNVNRIFIQSYLL